jgi:hypothetical protein
MGHAFDRGDAQRFAKRGRTTDAMAGIKARHVGKGPVAQNVDPVLGCGLGAQGGMVALVPEADRAPDGSKAARTWGTVVSSPGTGVTRLRGRFCHHRDNRLYRDRTWFICLRSYRTTRIRRPRKASLDCPFELRGGIRSGFAATSRLPITSRVGCVPTICGTTIE